MAGMQGKNSISSRQYNRGLILQLIATGACRTRIELSKKTKLTKMTITNIISEFIERDIVVESEEELTEVCGRNPVLLKISDKAPKVAGLLIFRDRIEAVLCSLTMDILKTESICFDHLTEAEMIQNSYDVLDRILRIGKNIMGIGVAIIGPVDIRKGRIINPPRFYDIKNVDILKVLKERYEFPIYLDHDNNSAALAEKLFGIGKDFQDFIFLGISNGIGSGIVSNGEVYHNSRGLAPEIGHMSIDRNGLRCSCGNKGCLEMYASTYVILKKLQAATGKDVGFAEFCRLGGKVELKESKETEKIHQIFEEMIEDISIALINSINVLHSELIVLGHDCIEWDEKYVRLLEDRINDRKMAQDGSRVLVRKAFFEKNAQLIGAAVNIANQAFKGKLLFAESN